MELTPLQTIIKGYHDRLVAESRLTIAETYVVFILKKSEWGKKDLKIEESKLPPNEKSKLEEIAGEIDSLIENNRLGVFYYDETEKIYYYLKPTL